MAFLDHPTAPASQFSSPSKNEGDVLREGRLAAQPLDHFRFVVIIVTTNLKSQLSVRSLSLGQSLPSRSAQVPIVFRNLCGYEAGACPCVFLSGITPVPTQPALAEHVAI